MNVMKKIKLSLFFLSISTFFLVNSAQAAIYKHVDKDGKVTYSNVPSANAKQLNLPPIVVMPPSTNSSGAEERILQRRESMKFEEQNLGALRAEMQTLTEKKPEPSKVTP